MAGRDFGQVGSDLVQGGVALLVHRFAPLPGAGGGRRPTAHDDQAVAGHYRIAGGDNHVGDQSGARGGYHVFELHGLDDDELLVLVHLVAGADGDQDDGALYGRRDRDINGLAGHARLTPNQREALGLTDARRKLQLDAVGDAVVRNPGVELLEGHA